MGGSKGASGRFGARRRVEDSAMEMVRWGGNIEEDNGE